MTDYINDAKKRADDSGYFVTDYINDAKKRADDSGYFVTDYIKRKDAIGLAKDIILPSGAIIGYHSTKPIVIWRCIDADEVMDIPSADVRENVKGHWVVDRYCSVCDFDKYEADYCCGGLPQNFCPNCGADMRNETND